MSSWKTHMIFGLLFSIIIVIFFYKMKYLELEFHQYFFFIPVVFFSALLPDIDTKKSIIGRIVFLTGIMLIIGSSLLYYIYENPLFLFILFSVFLSFILIHLLKHRGFTHSIIGGLFVLLPMLFLGIEMYVISFVAYFSHLLLDGEIKFF